LGWLNYEVVKVVGAATGIVGVSMGLVLVRYERVIRERLFPERQPHQAYAQLRMITYAVWIAALIGLCAWLYALAATPR
jgi:site-specific recombinase